MSEHFRFYPNQADTVVPWNARYQFPSQSNKATKSTPRIPPKNGAIFSPVNAPYIRLEAPAEGYIDMSKSTIEFDVTLVGRAVEGNEILRFQNNIQSIFRRVRHLYGGTPLEDIQDYNLVVRALSEWTATNPMGTIDGTSIDQGLGGAVMGWNGANSASMINARQYFIQGIDNTAAGVGAAKVPNAVGSIVGYAGLGTTRRYQVSLATGLWTQPKLMPAKWMAAQFATEIELAPAIDCIFLERDGAAAGTGAMPTYQITNVNFLPEIVHFDPAYDEMFLRGLREGGVPLKFGTWNSFTFNIGGQTNVNLNIQERSRSVKALFAIQRRAPTTFYTDSGAMLTSSAGVLQQFQWRIGGRYFPSAPVQMTLTPSGSVTNGGAEAWVELEKALNITGDYRLSCANNALRWGQEYVIALEGDYNNNFNKYDAAGVITGTAAPAGSSGNIGSQCFAAAVSLESSNGTEISGLNAEEQSDISFMATYSTAQAASFTMTVLSYVDKMMVLRENNAVELIQ
jgi:hypothetical protein